MDGKGRFTLHRRKRLEREVVFWRIVGLVAIGVICLGFAQSNSQKEIRFTSTDGRQSVEVSASGITFLDKGKTLGHIGFETIGDGDQQEVDLKLTGVVTSRGANFQSGDNRLLLNAEHVNLVQKSGVRTSLTSGGLELQDKGGKAKISISTPDQGLGGLDFVDQGNLILSLGALGKFRGDNPPRRNAGAIHIADFGTPFKSRQITASDSEATPNH